MTLAPAYGPMNKSHLLWRTEKIGLTLTAWQVVSASEPSPQSRAAMWVSGVCYLLIVSSVIANQRPFINSSIGR